MPQKGGKEQKEKKVRPAAGQSAGGKELREVALLFRFTELFHSSCSPHTLPHNPQTMEGLSQRSRSKETKLFFSWALEDSELHSTAQKLGRITKADRCFELRGRAELKHQV